MFIKTKAIFGDSDDDDIFKINLNPTTKKDQPAAKKETTPVKPTSTVKNPTKTSNYRTANIIKG
jgi:hypothetical protein